MFSVPRNRRLLQSLLVGALGLVIVALVGSTLQAEDVNPTEVLAVKWLPKPAPAENADAKTEAEMKAYTEAIPGTDLKFGMAPIPGGKFLMGSPANEKGHKDDEGPQVEVTIDPFWMGIHEITWTEYETWSFKLDIQRRKMLNQQPTFWDKLADAIARPTNPYTDMSFEMGKEDRPAICMTQYGAQMYCKWLCAKTGRYYRLPTEAEWEYARRRAPRRPTPLATIRPSWATMPGTMTTATRSTTRSARRSPTPGASTTCTATSVSGSSTSTSPIPTRSGPKARN